MVNARNIVALLVALAGVARAEERRGYLWTAYAGTDAGVDIAAGAQVETPIGLRFMATVGQMPNGYAWGFKQYYTKAYGGSAGLGDLLQDTLEFAFVARGNVTWRPLVTRGFFFGAGYIFQSADKSGVLASTIEEQTGEMLPASDQGAVRTFSTTVRAHMVDGMAGWEWGLSKGFVLRVSLGALVIVHTTASFSPDYAPGRPDLTMHFTDSVSNKLTNAGTGVIAPEGALYLGYTF